MEIAINQKLVCQLGNMLKMLLFFLAIIFQISCSVFKSDEQAMLNTVKLALEKINNNDTTLYKMGEESLVSANEYRINFMRERAFYFISKFHNNDISKLKIKKDPNPDNLGSNIYRINLLNKLDSSTAIYYYDLLIYVGPKQFISLDKISGIDEEMKIDEDLNTILTNTNNQKEFYELIEDLKK